MQVCWLVRPREQHRLIEEVQRADASRREKSRARLFGDLVCKSDHRLIGWSDHLIYTLFFVKHQQLTKPFSEIYESWLPPPRVLTTSLRQGQNLP